MDNTHASDTLDPRSAVQVAICGVRFESRQVDQTAPTCPWCAKKLKERGNG